MTDYTGVDPSRPRAGDNMRQQHRPTNCPCTNDIRIMEKKHVSPIHLLEELPTRLVQCGDMI